MDYREIISQAFHKKREINPRYSLRAFARDISVSPSRLSEVMTGKGELSREKAVVVAKKLALPPMLTLDFPDMIDVRSAPSESERARAAARIEKRKKSSKKTRKFFNDEHFAKIFEPKLHVIWNFMQLRAFDGNPETILKFININSIELYDALRGLEGLGLAKRDGLKWHAVTDQFTAGNKMSSEVIRAYHRKMADAGKSSIDTLQFGERHLHSVIIPFNSSRFGEVQEKITQFTLSLNDEFGSPADADAVYGLALQFFKMLGTISSQKPNQK